MGKSHGRRGKTNTVMKFLIRIDSSTYDLGPHVILSFLAHPLELCGLIHSWVLLELKFGGRSEMLVQFWIIAL